jgi:hypothetical protein
MDPTELSGTPAGREAYDLVNREFRRNQEQALDDYLARGTDVLSRAWMQATTISTANLRMTAEELERLSAAVYRVLDESILAFRDREPPAGARPVQVQFNAFPIIGGQEQES